MHLHIGATHALVIFANVLIVGFFWRLISMKFAEKPIGQAMAFIY